jgi:hypothetical protein
MFWTYDAATDSPPAEGQGGRRTWPPVDCRAAPFTRLVASWNAAAPAGTVITPAVRVRVAGRWSPWYSLAHWGTGLHPETGEPLPRSLPVQPDGPGSAWVDIDTLRLKEDREADAFQMRVRLRGHGGALPRLHLLAVTTYRADPPGAGQARAGGGAFRLPVPERSQQVEAPDIAGLICSPTCVGMVLAYYGLDRPTTAVAAGVRDAYGEETYGNWPFNTAYAATHGLRATVRHFPDLDAVEAELRAGRPVILSVAWEPGDLPAAPIPRSSGHLIVATGVDEHGDFYVNDPAADPRQGQPVARRYSRAHLARAFRGIGYVIEPPASNRQ